MSESGLFGPGEAFQRSANMASAAAVLQAAIRSFEQEATEFIASPKFAGAKPGYYFGKGAHGVG